jgi:hypothetical protein
MPPDDPVYLSPDLKTLRLATPELDSAKLARFLAYQRALVEHATSSPGKAAFGQAHAVAMEVSKLTPKELSRIGPVVADFAGRRWTAHRLAARHDALVAKGKTGAALTPREAETLRKLPLELRKARDTHAMGQRYGAAVVELLMANEAEWVALHERVTALARGG